MIQGLMGVLRFDNLDLLIGLDVQQSIRFINKVIIGRVRVFIFKNKIPIDEGGGIL